VRVKLGWGTATHRWDASRVRLSHPTVLPTCITRSVWRSPSNRRSPSSPAVWYDRLRAVCTLQSRTLRRNETALPLPKCHPNMTEPNSAISLITILTVQCHDVECLGRLGGPRARGGGHAGRAGARVGRKSSARARTHAASPAPSAAPSHARRSTLAAPGQDQLLRSGVGPLFWL